MECEGQTIEHDTVRIHTGDFARANGAGVDQRIEPLVLRHHRARGPGERGNQRGAQNAMSGGHATIVPQSALPMVPIVVYKQGAMVCLLKTPYPLRRLRLRAFFDSLQPCRPSSFPCSTRSNSWSAHGCAYQKVKVPAKGTVRPVI